MDNQDTAVARVRRFRQNGREAPAPIKACPWCSTPFEKDSFACIPTQQAPRNMEIRCANPSCAFTGNKSLPILTVDEVIYTGFHHCDGRQVRRAAMARRGGRVLRPCRPGGPVGVLRGSRSERDGPEAVRGSDASAADAHHPG